MNIIKYKLLILFFLFNFNNAISSKESLLEEDTLALQDDGNKILFGREIHGFTITEENFEKLFPINSLESSQNNEEIDESTFVGQIEDSNKVGLGTGFLYDLYQEDDNLIGIGFSAFHIFFHISEKENNKYIINKGCSFIINRKSLSLRDKKFITNYGTIKIESIIFNIDSFKKPNLLKRDICLFRGKLVLPKHLNSISTPEKYLSFFHDNRVENILTTTMRSNFSISEACMYHFPLGKKEMRVNKASIVNKYYHKIKSLTGSSGAPIFDKRKQIIGIHTGSSTSISDKFAYYLDATGTERISTFSNENTFENFSEEDYLDLLNNGVDLFKLTKDQIGLLQIRLIEDTFVDIVIEEIPSF